MHALKGLCVCLYILTHNNNFLLSNQDTNRFLIYTKFNLIFITPPLEFFFTKPTQLIRTKFTSNIKVKDKMPNLPKINK